MKTKKYTWSDYGNRNEIDQKFKELQLLLLVRDRLMENDEDAVYADVISLPVPKEHEVILGVVGGLFPHWVIDQIAENNGVYHLLFRNCSVESQPFNKEILTDFLEDLIPSSKEKKQRARANSYLQMIPGGLRHDSPIKNVGNQVNRLEVEVQNMVDGQSNPKE